MSSIGRQFAVTKSLPHEAEAVLGEIDQAGSLVDALRVALRESNARALPLYLAAEWWHCDILRRISDLTDAEAELVDPAYTHLELALRDGMEQCVSLFSRRNSGN